MRGLAVAMLLAFAAWASACANLPDVTAGVCGNGVIEPGEDCDGGSDCDHCSLVCGADRSCKDGYACGYDNLCHAPSGVFQQTSTHTFEFPDFAGVTPDVNGDGIPDMIAVSTTSMTVTLGDPHGELSQQMTQASPRIADPGAFTARALGDDQAEILFATPDGIAGYTADNQQLLPFPFANDVGKAFQGCQFLASGTVHPIGALPFDGHHVTGIVVDDSSHQVYVVVLDVVAGTCGYAAACDLTSADIAPLVVGDVYVTSPITGGTPSEIAVVSIAQDAQHPTGNACVVRASVTGGTIQVDAPGASIPTHGTPPVLARLSSAPCPWLVIGGGRSDSGLPDAGVTARAPTAPDAIGCNVGSTTVAIAGGGILPYANPTGHIPLAPPVAGQAPDAIALVTGDGAQGVTAIVSVDPPAGAMTAAHAMFAAPTPLTSITSAALEGDPTRISGIAGSPSDIEILRRPGGAATFSAYSIPTAGFTKHVVTGDFDANGYPDIVYVEHLTDGDRAMIAYGTPDLVLSPVELARFTDVIRLLPIDTPDSNDPSNVIPDLAVLDLPAATPPQPPTLTVFHGSPQRTLHAYYDPRTGHGTTFAALVTGNFLGHDPSSGIQDVLALEEPPATDKAANINVYAIPGLASPELGDSPGMFPGVGLGFAGCDQQGTVLCADDAILEPWPLGNREVAIGFDAGGDVATIDPVQQTIVPSTPGKPALEVPGLRGMFGASLHGTRQLYVLFGTLDFATFQGNVLVCDVSDAGTVTACRDLATNAPGLAGWNCNDAATGPMTPRGPFDPAPSTHADDLVALCHPSTCSPGSDPSCGRVWRVTSDGASYQATPVLDRVDAQVMILTDVTGDAVPDLLLLSIGGDIPVMQIFPQCEARDLACRTENAR